ncbi:MAG: hypothetical protein IE909_12300, partial [Campylobacterales bacterium]|nr:hypothetical protein [Campylobacterales bacterium]
AKEYIDKFKDFNENYYLISLGSGGVEKILPIEKTYQLIQYIYIIYKLKPVIVLNPGQEFLQDKLIQEYLNPNNIEFIKLEKMNLRKLMALMSVSKFIIVPDTGLFHMAIALKVPVFSVFTYTHPNLVKPQESIATLCYEETESNDHFGLPICTNQISINKIKMCFDQFIKII